MVAKTKGVGIGMRRERKGKERKSCGVCIFRFFFISWFGLIFYFSLIQCMYVWKNAP